MPDKLAKLADLKSAVNANTSGIDAELTALLQSASAMAENAAGLATGGLRRQVGLVEYPHGDGAMLRLTARPIESVAEVLQVSSRATPTEFDTIAADGSYALAEGEDYFIASRILGSLHRLDRHWHARPYTVRVTYTGGYADPDDAIGGDAVEPPLDLQRAVIAQAVLLFNTRRLAGVKSVKAGDANGAIEQADLHPLLAQVASRYRTQP